MTLHEYIEDLIRQAEMRDPREGSLMIHVGEEVQAALREELGGDVRELGGHRVNPFSHSVPDSDTVVIEQWPYKAGHQGGDYSELFFAVRIPVGLSQAEGETYLQMRREGMSPHYARGVAVAIQRED